MRMFGRVAATAALLCAVLSLSGCSPPSQLYLINHTGRTIEVLRSAGRWRDEDGVVRVEPWNRLWGWPFLIDYGAGRRVDYAMETGEWILDVRMTRCRVHYEASMDAVFAVLGGGHIMMQLEPDERLYLVAPPMPQDGKLAAVDIAPFVAIQPEGFPVQPSSRVCPR